MKKIKKYSHLRLLSAKGEKATPYPSSKSASLIVNTEMKLSELTSKIESKIKSSPKLQKKAANYIEQLLKSS